VRSESEGLSDKEPQKREFKLLDTPEARAIYEEAKRKWDERLKPMTEAIRRSQQISGDDLNIRVGPCRDD